MWCERLVLLVVSLLLAGSCAGQWAVVKGYRVVMKADIVRGRQATSDHAWRTRDLEMLLLLTLLPPVMMFVPAGRCPGGSLLLVGQRLGNPAPSSASRAHARAHVGSPVSLLLPITVPVSTSL